MSKVFVVEVFTDNNKNSGDDASIVAKEHASDRGCRNTEPDKGTWFGFLDPL